ncbi:MAG TPA: translocation/assembly module TamB domain-containing protein, partial [Terriglobales bacterium]|nr:translocation/assembly module TamB domain-containing protein [Terriglobales bacterium]
EWKYSPSDPISASLSVRQMPIAQLQQLARVNYPIVGNLSADVSLRGSQLNPEGNGSAEITRARVYEQAVQNLSLNFQAAGDTVHSTLALKTPAGGANADLTLHPKSKGYELQMNIPGINLAQLDAVQQRNAGVSGVLTATASGKGTLDDPQLAATVQIPQLQVREASIKGVKAQMNVANHRADLSLDSQLLNSSVQARSTVNLTGDYYAQAALDTKGLPLGPLIALYKPVPPQFEGVLEFHASAKGPLKDKSRMEAHLVIPTLRAAYQQIEIANTRPIKVDYVNSVVAIAPSEIRGTDSLLQFQGEIPLKGSATPRLTVQGSVDMQLLRIFDPEVQSSGKVALDIHATRSKASQLGIQGQVRLENIAFSTVAAPMGVANLNGIFDIDDNQVRITRLTGQSGGGQITGGGAVTYKPEVRFNMALDAKGVRLRYPEGMRTVLDSSVTLGGTPQRSSLNGRVLIDSLGFTPDFDLASFIGQFAGNSAPPTGQGFAQNLKLNVAVQSTSQLNLVNSEVSLQGQANLRVVGTAADPVIVGRANFNGGDLFFRNRRYTLQRGIINFVNPNETQPVVNMVITTSVEQYNLTLTFLGPIDRLRTSYTSDPPLSPVDVINLLARGRTTEEAAPASMNANSVLAQGLAGQVSNRVQKLAGFSSLQIDPTLGGNGTNPTARVAVQQRVTKNFLFTFSTDVSNAESQTVAGEYQISKRWSVTANRDQNGGVAVGGKFHKVF